MMFRCRLEKKQQGALVERQGNPRLREFRPVALSLEFVRIWHGRSRDLQSITISHLALGRVQGHWIEGSRATMTIGDHSGSILHSHQIPLLDTE
jgi:hypothetical protein